MLTRNRIAGAALSAGAIAIWGDIAIRGFNVILVYFYHDGSIDWLAVRSAVGALMLLAGLFLLLRPADKTAEHGRRQSLITCLERLLHRLDLHQPAWPADLYGEMAAAYVGLDRLGIQTP
jgi:hypothetical protein